MKIAFVMDPMTRVKPHKDTTFFLMLAAKARGHDLFYVHHSEIRVRDGRVKAAISHVDVFDRVRDYYALGPAEIRDLDDMDVVLIRTDPPFDRRYAYMTMFLDLLGDETLVLNRPAGLRGWNEKLAALKFPRLTPRSCIARHIDELLAFQKRVGGKMVVKPIDGHGGRGIFILEPDDGNLDQTLLMVTRNQSHWVVAQEYVPDAVDGDKRILLLDGEPLGAILRVHAQGKQLNNLDAGGTANPVELSRRDLEICGRMGPELREAGLFFVGIDLLGDALIEVNVTSPTGLREAARFADKPLNHSVIESIERKVAALGTSSNGDAMR